MYIVVCHEYGDGFSSPISLVGKFKSKKDAEDYVERDIERSIRDFPEEIRDGKTLYTTDNEGRTDYGYELTVLEV